MMGMDGRSVVPTILLAVDGSRTSDHAVGWASALAEGTPLGVILLGAGGGPELGSYVERAACALKSPSIRLEAVTFREDLAAAIVRTARVRNVDLVVMGNLRPAGSVGLDPVLAALSCASPAPVLLAGTTPRGTGLHPRLPATVAALFDESGDWSRMLDPIERLGNWMSLSVHVVALAPTAGIGADGLSTKVQRTLTAAGHGGLRVRVLAAGDPSSAARALTDGGAADILAVPVHRDWPRETGCVTPLIGRVLDAVDCSVLLTPVAADNAQAVSPTVPHQIAELVSSAGPPPVDTPLEGANILTRRSPMVTILCVGTSGLDDPTRASLPFAAALAAIEAGHQPQIALMGNAASLMIDSVADKIQGTGWPALKELLRQVVAHQISIFVCEGCCRRRGISGDDLVTKGARFASPKGLLELKVAADKVLIL
jgi:predicted peroxiredoxin/nucleotide-binding universal stress UspA family protein